MKEKVIPNVTSYFLFKPEITIPEVCYNAKTNCCKDCQEPECDLVGWTNSGNKTK